MGKVIVLVVGVVLLGAMALPAGAYTYQNAYSYSSPYGLYGSPYGMGGVAGMGTLSSIYGPFGPFGMGGMGGLGGIGGLGSSFGSPLGYSYGSSPYYSSGTSLPTTSSSKISDLPTSDMFSEFGSDSPFGSLFSGGSIFKAKTYGPPPTDAIKKTLIGQRLTYQSSSYGIPLQYQIEDSDIGDIAGTQYQGADAWKVRVGQQGMYWDVILNADGSDILYETQVQ